MSDRLLRPEWLPEAKPLRVIVHWTAGGCAASGLDREHYHFVLEDRAGLGMGGGVQAVRGKYSVADNDTTADKRYAAHTAGLNTKSIGVAAACMWGAVEGRTGGPAPLTRALWEGLARATAELCDRYGIAVTERTVLQHGEVERVLGVKQNGKWDCCWLPWEPNLTQEAVCSQFRRKCMWYLQRLPAD